MTHLIVNGRVTINKHNVTAPLIVYIDWIDNEKWSLHVTFSPNSK